MKNLFVHSMTAFKYTDLRIYEADQYNIHMDLTPEGKVLSDSLCINSFWMSRWPLLHSNDYFQSVTSLVTVRQWKASA